MKFIQNSPYNDEFGDIYFNTFNPVEESKFVFTNAIDEIWDKKDFFIVAECGFGTGLNFLNLAKKFKKTDKKLHYVSIEKNLLSAKDLQEIYEKLNKFKKISKNLIKKISKIQIGEFLINRIKFNKNITLDLVIGEANFALKELDFKADIWFMDGFSPSKNPQMWSLEICEEIARLSNKNCILRTFTSASFVAKNLKDSGFLVEKIPGFGKKREMICAKFNGEVLYFNPWFERENKKYKKEVLIIGAGIAGIATALKLQKLGFDVKIAEKEAKIATNGSGNLIGALMPLITKPGVVLGKMHFLAFNLAKKFYKKSKFAHFSGAKLFAFDDDLKTKYSFYKNYKEDLPYPSLFLDDCASVEVKKLLNNISQKLKILTKFEFVNYEKKCEKFYVKFSNGEILKSDVLIFTMGSHSEELFGRGENPKLNFDDFMQISSVRGQVTWLKPCVKTDKILNSKGYITPKFGKIQIIGATYDRLDYEKKSRISDDEKNISDVIWFLPKNYKIIGNKVGFRSYSGDRFPLIGQIYDAFSLRQNYKNIFWTKNKKGKILPFLKEGIFINAAHGSRGLCTAILGANIICDMLLNRPYCVEKSIINELNPARFLIRKLKKGLI